MEPHPDAAPADLRRGLFALVVGRPVGLFVVFATLLVIGAIAYQRIPLQLMPSGFSSPNLWIWVPNPGASARENEEKVARVIEEQLRTLSGIEELQSYSEEGLVQLRVEFDSSLPVDLMKAEVRDRLERARPLLPTTVDDMGFWSEDSDQLPVAFFGVLHPGDSDRTDFLINEIVIPRLEAVDGVSKVDVFGDLADSVRILLDEDRIRAANLDIGQLISRLSTDNFAQPLGEIDDGGRRYLLRSDMRFRSLAEIERYPIGNGLVVADVGRVITAKSVRDQLSRIDGNYSYFGVARKESQANVVDASRALLAAFDELAADPRLAGQVSFLPFFVQGKLIENSLAQLRGTAVFGGLLASLILYAFLRRLRLTLAVALSIPVSVLLAIAFEFFGGGSFNLLTMVGVTLAIGMLVDNAVVVVENIARRRSLGEAGPVAAVRGVREVALAVSLATLTTVVVFLPLIFMTESPEARIVFGGIGIPLSISLLFSLFVAVVFLPAVAARVLGERRRRDFFGSRFLGRLGALPARLLAHGLHGLRYALFAATWVLHRTLTLGLTVLSPRRRPWSWLSLGLRAAFGAAVIAAGVAADRGAERAGKVLALPGDGSLAPAQASHTYTVAAALVALAVLVLPPLLARRRRTAPARPSAQVSTATSLVDLIAETMGALVGWAVGHRRAATGLAAACLGSIVLPFSGLGQEAFTQEQNSDSVRYGVDFDTDYTLAEAADEIRLHEDFLDRQQEAIGFDHWSSRFDEQGGSLTIYWDEPILPSERKAHQRTLRREAPRPAGHRLRFSDSEQEGEFSANLAVFQLRGPDSEVLAQLGIQAERLLRGVEGLSSVRGPLSNAPNQLEIDFDRDLALSMGVNSETAQNTIAWNLRGWPLPQYQEEGREVPFLIEYDQEEVAGLSTLRDMQVFTGQGQVPLASFAALSFRPASRQIERLDGQITFALTAEVDDPTRATELTEKGYEALAALDLPRGYSLGLDSSARARQQEEFAEMGRAFLLSVVLVFLLMGILFESVARPFSVLVTIPFAVLGAIWTLWLVGTPMDVMAWIGLIILAGVVVNNGIVLIDRIHRLRGELDAEAGPEPDPDGERARRRRDLAVVQGTIQRVRPVLMTAMTTIIGLLPMILAEPATDAIDYRGLGTIVAGGLAASTFFTLWVVPLAYTAIDDLTRAAAAVAHFARFGRRGAPPREPRAAT